ncbi:MAG: M56 family metallopeptidase [Caulobacter sp.]
MSGFTAAYLARLEAWSLAAFLIQGAFLLLSWKIWSRTNASSDLRHRVACAHLGALALLAPITVAIAHMAIAHAASPAAGPSRLAGRAPLSVQADAALMVAWAPALIWSAGALWMLAALVRDLRRSMTLKTWPAEPAVEAAVRRLSSRRQIAPFQVREAQVTSPQVLGWPNPVLLVPPAARFDLPSAQRDALLLHELAHIERNDFAWNLAQRLLLAALWFHPAAWAIHRAVALERELRCDALAVRCGADRADLAKGLVRLAEGGLSPRLGMAAGGGGDLTRRVRHLTTPAANSSVGWATLLFSGAALCLTVPLALVPAAVDPVVGGLHNASDFGGVIRIGARDAAGEFEVAIRQGRVIEASLASNRVPTHHIVQRGDQVTLLDPLRRPAVTLQVAPQGAIRWRSRTAD